MTEHERIAKLEAELVAQSRRLEVAGKGTAYVSSSPTSRITTHPAIAADGFSFDADSGTLNVTLVLNADTSLAGATLTVTYELHELSAATVTLP